MGSDDSRAVRGIEHYCAVRGVRPRVEMLCQCCATHPPLWLGPRWVCVGRGGYVWGVRYTHHSSKDAHSHPPRPPWTPHSPAPPHADRHNMAHPHIGPPPAPHRRVPGPIMEATPGITPTVAGRQSGQQLAILLARAARTLPGFSAKAHIRPLRLPTPSARTQAPNTLHPHDFTPGHAASRHDVEKRGT